MYVSLIVLSAEHWYKLFKSASAAVIVPLRFPCYSHFHALSTATNVTFKDAIAVCQINGTNVERVAHGSAVQLFRLAGDTVRLTVQQVRERQNTVSYHLDTSFTVKFCWRKCLITQVFLVSFQSLFFCLDAKLSPTSRRPDKASVKLAKACHPSKRKHSER